MSETASESIDTVLRSDHAAITRALTELRAETGAATSGERFEELSADVVRHFVAEEQYLLPAVRHHLTGGSEIAEQSFAEHERIEHMLKTLDDDDTTDEQISTVLGELASAVHDHVQRQESEILPALLRACSEDELTELGRGVLGAEQLAPTHPRSFVPKSATLSKITSWLTGLVEKSWDSREADKRHADRHEER